MSLVCLVHGVSTGSTRMSVPCLHGLWGFHGNYKNECS